MSTWSLLIVLSLTSAAESTTASGHAFVRRHCLACHGPDLQEADVRLDDLLGESFDATRWSVVADQVREGRMPPAGEPRPTDSEREATLTWIARRTAAEAPRLPQHGNLVPHEVLFGPTAELRGLAGGPTRVWRLSPEGYLGFVRDVHRGRSEGIVQPFSLVPERGLRDYAALYAIDEPSTEILLRNAEAIVAGQSAHEIVDGRVRSKNDTVREFMPLMDPGAAPTAAQLASAVQAQFRLALGRAAADDEIVRFTALYDQCAVAGNRPAAARTMLAAVLLRADAMFRHELGTPAAQGRTRLTQAEIALAVGQALCGRKERGLTTAAERGELATADQVAAHVQRILDDPKVEKPRLLGFFRTYFGYDEAVNVFKDRPSDLMFEPQQYVYDTDQLVLHVLAEDRDVLRQLLTTSKSFVNIAWAEDKQTRRKNIPKRAKIPNAHNNRGQLDVEGMYGFSEWPAEQPATLSPGTRLGVLMQPSWLIAWSTNFDNDPVRRGRWIRERLLGGTVPDLPIGVAAQVPDEPERTFRSRLQVTRDARCWKCHRRMDELGLPFEQFDHYGRFREAEMVLDAEATKRHVDKKGQPLGPVLRPARLDVTGLIADSGDSGLEGAVSDPRELVLRLAASERVRQVFVRYVFRYHMGRNETAADAAILQAADRAYVKSGGSYRAMLTSLLASDSFLYRMLPTPSNTGSATTGLVK